MKRLLFFSRSAEHEGREYLAAEVAWASLAWMKRIISKIQLSKEMLLNPNSDYVHGLLAAVLSSLRHSRPRELCYQSRCNRSKMSRLELWLMFGVVSVWAWLKDKDRKGY